MVKIRLRRIGKKKAPFYRIVVADSRVAMNSRMIAEIGTYDPLKNPSEIRLDEEAARKWLANGAQPTETVSKIFKIVGITGNSKEKKAEEKSAEVKPEAAAEAAESPAEE